MMENTQFFVLVGMMATGFGWMLVWLRSIDKSVADIDKRLTVVETILAMMGAPIRNFKEEKK